MGQVLTPGWEEGGLGGFLVFVAQGVVGARSGSFGFHCIGIPHRYVQLSPDHSLNPAKKGEKEGVLGETAAEVVSCPCAPG